MRMMRLQTWITFLGLAALAACGTVKGDDTMMGDDMPPVDTTAPQLMSSTPSADATKVPIIAPLTFVFDESLDPATVTEASVKVEYVNYNLIQPVTGTVAYDDASKTVTFKPNLPLVVGGRYYVTLGALKDVAGNAFAGQELGFNTNVNAYTKQVSYNTSTNVIQTWTLYSIDMYGHPARYAYFDTPGADGQWFTSDDNARSHAEYIYTPTGAQQEYRYYDAGPDQIWNNGDDRIQDMSKYEIDSKGRVTGYSSIDAAGPDQMWGNADDILFGYSKTAYEPKVVRQVYYSAPGNDGQWKTPDDRVTSYQEYQLDDRGFRIGYISYGAGPDQLAKTSDDVVQSWTEQEIDANGTVLDESYHNNAGPDMMWFTADDATAQRVKYDLDASGYRLGYTYFTAAGPDTMWGTSDDIAAGRQSFTNDAHGLQTTSIGYSDPGPDGLWGTSDDELGGYQTFTYDQNGQQTDRKYYASPGPDNVWRTGDDRVSSDYDFDVAH